MNDKVDTEAIYTPAKAQRLFIEGATGDRMVRWKVGLDEPLLWVPNRESGKAWQFSLHAHILEAQFFAGVEERLKNQRESIDRMLKHLAVHCPQLLGAGQCQHMGS